MTIKSRLVKLERGTTRGRCTCRPITFREVTSEETEQDTPPAPCSVHGRSIWCLVAVRPAGAGEMETA